MMLNFFFASRRMFYHITRTTKNSEEKNNSFLMDVFRFCLFLAKCINNYHKCVTFKIIIIQQQQQNCDVIFENETFIWWLCGWNYYYFVTKWTWASRGGGGRKMKVTWHDYVVEDLIVHETLENREIMIALINKQFCCETWYKIIAIIA